MRTKVGMTLPGHPAVAVEDLDVRRRALAVMRDVLVRQEVRDRIDSLGERERRNQLLRTEGRRGIDIAAYEISLLLIAGASRADVSMLPLFLMELIDEMCEDGTLGGDRLALELENMRLDAEEDSLQGRALVEAETLEQMIERARALRIEASAKLALARHLEGVVRKRNLGLLQRAG